MSVHRNVWLASISFFFIFFGYGTAQQYLVVLFDARGDGHLALASLVILYGTFLIAGLFAAKLIPILGGLKRSLLLGAATYAIFVASVATESAPLLLLASCAIGIGAALLWVSSGQVVTDSGETADAGRNLALQQIGLYAGGIVGLWAGRFLAETFPLPQTYLILAAVIGIGIAFAVEIEPVKEALEPRPLRMSFAFDRRMLALFPIVFGASFLQGEVVSAMSVIVVSVLGMAAIPLVISVVKVSSIVGNFGAGPLCRFADKRVLLSAVATIALVGVAAFASTHTFAPMLAGALLLGFSMAAMYPVTLALLKETMPENEFLYALGVFHAYSNFGVIVAIVANLYLPAGVSFIPGAIALLIAVPSLWVR